MDTCWLAEGGQTIPPQSRQDRKEIKKKGKQNDWLKIFKLCVLCGESKAKWQHPDSATFPYAAGMDTCWLAEGGQMKASDRSIIGGTEDLRRNL